MERLSILAPPPVTEALLGRFLGTIPDEPPPRMSLEQLERQYIQEVLVATSGNKSAAAEILGITRNTLYAKIKVYELSESEES